MMVPAYIVDIAVALLALVGVMTGIFVAKRKRKAEVESLATTAANSAVGVLLQAQQQLEKENLEQRERIEQLNASVEALKRRNTELTNSVFTDAIADLEKKQGYKEADDEYGTE